MEPANGDSYRYQGGMVDEDISPDFHLCNRGKLSIVVNARNEAGLEVFKRLLGSADIFLTNYRPGVLEGWGCGFEEMAKINPNLIYCLVSGYGQTGPYSSSGCFDTAVQALSGLADFQGMLNTSYGEERLPQMIQDAVIDKTTAYTVKDAVTSALYARDVHDAGGQLVEVSLLESGQSFVWPHAMKGNTFFDGENEMRPIGGHRFGWHAQHVGFTREPLEGYGKTEREVNKETGRLIYANSDDDVETETIDVYASYADPLVGAPITKMTEVHKNPQTVHNANIVERPLYGGGRVVVREPKPAARFMGTPTGDAHGNPGVAPHLGEHRAQILEGTAPLRPRLPRFAHQRWWGAGLGYDAEGVAELEERGAFSWAMRSRF